MSDIRIEIPASLGLSSDDIERLTEAFRNQIVGTINATLAGTAVTARPQTVIQSKAESTVKEVGKTVELRQ
jgi:hypothetical protein